MQKGVWTVKLVRSRKTNALMARLNGPGVENQFLDYDRLLDLADLLDEACDEMERREDG